MSRFKAMRTRRDDIRNKGFDYDGKILLRTTDPNLYKNDRIRGFALHLEGILQQWWRNAKQVRTFFNYAVPADSDDIN